MAANFIPICMGLGGIFIAILLAHYALKEREKNMVIQEQEKQVKKKSRKENRVADYVTQLEFFKQQGLFVKIRHDRRYRKLFKNDSPYCRNTYGVHEIFITKGMRRHRDENGKQEYDGYELVNNGGRTTVSIYKNDKDVDFIAQGVAQVNPCDNFIRKVGLTKAVGLAFAHLKETAPNF